jgi:hypothetical protein
MAMNDDHITRLESEIRYLKGLLDENGIPYDYEAFVETARREEPVEIEFPELKAEHAIQFYSYLSPHHDRYTGQDGCRKWVETPHDAYLYQSSSSCFTFFYSSLFSFILLYSFICRKDTDIFRMNHRFF